MKKGISLILIIFFYSCTDKRTATECYNSGMKSYIDSSFSNALENFSLATEKDNKNAKAFYYKGLCEVKLQKNKDALISFQKSIELDNNFYQALVERAKLKIILGDYASACNDCDKAKFIKKDFSEIYKTKALAFENLNDPSNAIIAYESALKYGQQDGETYYKLGVLKLGYGNHDTACALLSKAGELGFMEAFELIKSKCNKEISIQKNKINVISPNQSVRSEEYYQSKGYQIFPEFRIAVKCDCKLQDISTDTPGNFDISLGCANNTDSKEKVVMYQVMINKFPLSYSEATYAKKKKFAADFFSRLGSTGNSKRVIFNNEDAIVVDYIYKGKIKGKSIAFIKDNANFGFNVMTNDNIDQKFNKLTNNIEFF
jgi:tetratricopeptide (TPR) repeat protein